MEKINIAELLKDCPKGMELDCTCADNVVFDKIIEYNEIKCVIGECREPLILDKYGRLRHICCPKCVIFPKGKTTWEGFKRPFKDGDVVATLKGNQIFIFKENVVNIDNSFSGVCYCGYDIQENGLFKEMRLLFSRHATEEEKEKLFKAIKDNGYRWNPETKTLEKLIVPKFKVGDRIKHKLTGDICKVLFVLSNGCSGGVYDVAITNEIGKSIDIEEQDSYELAPNKFDITTLKPFESRVLVRTDNRKWVTAFYSHYDKDSLLLYCVVGGLWYEQCIPYEGNEHLLNTTNECDDYYKTWE
jgi:hypothetical protein